MHTELRVSTLVLFIIYALIKCSRLENFIFGEGWGGGGGGEGKKQNVIVWDFNGVFIKCQCVYIMSTSYIFLISYYAADVILRMYTS